MASVLPKDAEWLRTRAVAFDPEKNTVTTEDGQTIEYEYAVLAMGLQVSFRFFRTLHSAALGCISTLTFVFLPFE